MDGTGVVGGGVGGVAVGLSGVVCVVAFDFESVRCPTRICAPL